MSDSRAEFEVELSLGSLVYLAALAGLSGGFVVGIFSAIYALVKGEWLVGLVAIPLNSLAGCFTCAAYAFFGFRVYRRLSRRTQLARTLTGIFVPVHHDK